MIFEYARWKKITTVRLNAAEFLATLDLKTSIKDALNGLSLDQLNSLGISFDLREDTALFFGEQVCLLC